MRARIPALFLAVTIGFFGLTACGSDDDKDSKSSDDAATSQTDDAQTESTETESAETETETESTETEATEPDGDKPSREDVIAGYSKIVTDQGAQTGMELPADIVDTVVTCFVDEVYDDASAKTLQALADSNAAGVDPADTKLFTDAQATCTKEAMG